MTLKEKIFFAEFPKMPQRNSIIRSYLLLKLLKKKELFILKMKLPRILHGFIFMDRRMRQISRRKIFMDLPKNYEICENYSREN